MNFNWRTVVLCSMLDTLCWSLSPPAVSDWLWGKTWYLYLGALGDGKLHFSQRQRLERVCSSVAPSSVMNLEKYSYSVRTNFPAWDTWGRLQLSRDRECTVSSEGKGWIDGWINEWMDRWSPVFHKALSTHYSPVVVGAWWIMKAKRMQMQGGKAVAKAASDRSKLLLEPQKKTWQEASLLCGSPSSNGLYLRMYTKAATLEISCDAPAAAVSCASAGLFHLEWNCLESFSQRTTRAAALVKGRFS